MEYRLLGPLEVSEGGVATNLRGGKPAAVLAILLLNRNQVVSTDTLIDELWGANAPRTAVKTLQLYVSQVRKRLPENALLTRSSGYVLTVDSEAVDIDRFERLVSEGRAVLAAGDPEEAAARLREALAVWRGPALADFTYEPFARGEIERLEELRLTALETRLEADLARGRHVDVVGELETLVREHPLREQLRAQLMLALYRSGRQADALAAYRDGRRLLHEELGIEPGPELRRVEQAILRQEGSAAAPARPRFMPERKRVSRRAALAGLLLAAVASAVAVAAFRSGESGALFAANTLVEIDPATGSVAGHVTVGKQPTGREGPGSLPTGRTIAVGEGAVWVANPAAQTVTRIDEKSLKTTTIGGFLGYIAEIAAGSGSVWAAVRDQGLVRIDPRSSTVADTIPVTTAGGFRYSVEGVASSGGSVWLATTGLGDLVLVRLDARTQQIVARRALGRRSDGHSVATGAGVVWVTDLGANTLFRIAERRLRVQPISLVSPGVVAVGDNIWVTDELDAQLWEVDPEVKLPRLAIPLGRGSRPVSVAVGAGKVWVSSYRRGTVIEIDPRTRTVVRTIKLGKRLGAIAFGARRVWVVVTSGPD